MYPGCRLMDLHPRERGQMPYAPHHFPGFGHVPSQAKMDTARPPVNYESFPCYGSYGCSYPMSCHGCYHNQIPGYPSFGLHYPHYAPPSPVYCHGSYPPLPGSYHYQYIPSPHYSAPVQPYEYDKKGPVDHHFCGCSNHLCQQREKGNVEIEEQTSDDEKDRVVSLVPSKLKDQSYPVLWIPPGYDRKEEGEKAVKQEPNRESGFDKEAKESLKPCAKEPDLWNGWLPIDLNNLNSLVQGREEKETDHQKNEDSRSSFPVGCMPSYPKQKDKLELEDGDQKSIQDPSPYRFFPLKFIENQDKKSMPEGNAKNIENSRSEEGSKIEDKNVVKKIIPVKQLDQSKEKVLSEYDQTEKNRAPKVEKNYSEMPLKHTDKKGENEHLEKNRKVQSSLSKPSKLPPVCLRVDPLPSQRTKGGSSRSLSPPANKKNSEILSQSKPSSSSIIQGNKQKDTQCSADSDRGFMQENKQQDMQSSADPDLGRLQSEKKIKDIAVVDNTLRENKIEAQEDGLSQSPAAGDSQERVLSDCQGGKGVKSDQEFPLGDEVKNVDKSSGKITKDNKIMIEDGSGVAKCETGANGVPIDTKKSEHTSTYTSTDGAPNQSFSEAEAAVIIQSAYRGFEVRRWEPLKKLKEIARIEGELIKVRLDVQNLVSLGSRNIDKQKLVIGETIMNLLLQLDTMQGLHPNIRNRRKSVAKELVGLQEKLDSITSQNSEELKETHKSAGEISKSASEEERQQVGEDIHEQDENSLSPVRSDVKEPCQDQPHSLMDVNISSGDVGKSELYVGKSELFSGPDEMEGTLEEKQPDSSDCVDLNGRHPEPPVEVTEQIEVHGVHKESFLVESKEVPSSVVAEEKLNPVQLQNLSSLVDYNSSEEDEVVEVNTDVPRVPEQNSNAEVSGEGLQIDSRRCTVEPGKLELVQDSDLTSLGNKVIETSVEDQQHTKVLAKCPKLSVLEDNIATAECSGGSSELKDNISAEGDSERDKELSGDDIPGTEFFEASKEKHVNDIKEANVCVVEGGDNSIDDVQTAVVGVDMKEISDIKEAANACEIAGEVDDKPDMHIANSVGVEMKETPEIKEAVDVREVGGDDKPAEDIQTVDSVGLEQREITEVDEFGRDVGSVEDIEAIGTIRPELEDLSTAMFDLHVKQQNLSFIKDTSEEVYMEENANCNTKQIIAVDKDQGKWEDKFDNQEIYETQSNGNIVDLSGDLLKEELGTEKINKQPHREVATGKVDVAGEEPFVEQPQKEVPASLPVSGQISRGTEREIEKQLVEENEKLKEAVEKLIAAGKEQLTSISSLSERVKDLEKKLSRKKKLKMRRNRSPSRHVQVQSHESS